jgi:hypothetical protein
MNNETVKGTHVIQAAAYVDGRLGPDTFKTLAKSLGGARWAVLLPSSWYDVNVLREILTTLSGRIGVSIEDMTTEIARRNAEEDLTSVYRFFLRIVQPQRVLGFTPKLWQTYVSFGTATAVTNEKGRYVGLGEGYPEALLDWACGCWRGFIPATIELSGGKNPRGTIVKRWRMDNHLYAVQFEATYS